MADACRRAQEYGQRVGFGELIGRLHHLVGLFGRRRIEYGKVGVLREAAGVLLRLRGPGAGVVGDGDHHAAPDPDIGEAHQRVGGDVEPHLLHRAEGARAGVGRARRDLEGHLLISRPLYLHAGMTDGDESLDYLRRRRPRISGRHLYPGGQRSERDSFVSHADLYSH
ncbi:hypothetical protein SDC9_174272 [bioreactor metagenome]|uniref:Uncharacterized protein n=1 Tax=bioreactor metagenome TaxID=1076179 RepID=A0A645GKV0_9ZZZZ